MRVRARGRWRWVVAAAAFVLAVHPRPADAEEAVKEDREISVVPLVGGDTDHGFGAGALGSVAMFDPDHTPWKWKVEFGGFYAVKGNFPRPSFVDAYALITFPQLLDKRLRLEIRPSFTKDTALEYYGLGNRPPQPADYDEKRDTYERLHPALSVMTLWKGPRKLSLLVGARYIYNRVTFDPSSTLARDTMTFPHDHDAPHSVVTVEAGIVYDSRDSELAPTRGHYHAVKLRVSPGVGDGLPYGYQQINATVRFYQTLVPRYLVFAARAVFDLQLGDVPFYEMSRFEDASAIGGSQGVRGVPAYRFYGRVKAFGNLELRTEVTRFRWLDRPFILGFAGFFDGGRLWTDIHHARPDLDGAGTGLHYGVGGGVRIQKGRSFLLRVDVAWSPDAEPIGIYVLANHAF
ncbi:MAG: hypothetical protein JWP01_1899 [Myxococcales bacterium]|nr:hypothetical protein [Myxococcales bacterium]